MNFWAFLQQGESSAVPKKSIHVAILLAKIRHVRAAGVVMKTSGISTDQVQIVCTFLIMLNANQMQWWSFSLT